MTLFEGSMVAVVTPFKNGQVDEAALKNLVDFHIQNGTQAIVPCGTTGEASTLSAEEYHQVVSLVVKQAQKKILVIAGAGSNSTAEAIKKQKLCSEIGVDATLQITPYYNKPSQEGLYQHFKAIAESTDLPIILYNVPGRTSVNMLAETTIRLAKIKNIVGVKEASGNLVQASSIINHTADDFVLLSGEDALTYPLYALGAKGMISVTANVTPQKCADQYLAFKKGDLAGAKKIHDELLPLHNVLFIDTNPVPVKAALKMMGLIQEEYRLPLVPMDQSKHEVLKSVLSDLKILR